MAKLFVFVKNKLSNGLKPKGTWYPLKGGGDLHVIHVKNIWY